MCRSIVRLRRKGEPVHLAEIQASAVQYLRKTAGITTPLDRQRTVPRHVWDAELRQIVDATARVMRAAGSDVVEVMPPQRPVSPAPAAPPGPGHPG